ncbi:MAG: ubiquinol-cytochrome c reductase iron-sulfur subunit [Candidatus Binatia bacterium]
MNESGHLTRRDWLALLLMGVGLVASYGTFALQGVMFLLPRRVRPRTRRLFAGQVDQYKIGSVQSFLDLRGNEILVKRSDSGLQAFSSACPHLGCRVHWEAEKQRFFCPCHKGVFNADGVAVSGPPAAAGQSLSRIPLEMDDKTGVVYLEVKDVKRKRHEL